MAAASLSWSNRVLSGPASRESVSLASHKFRSKNVASSRVVPVHSRNARRRSVLKVEARAILDFFTKRGAPQSDSGEFREGWAYAPWERVRLGPFTVSPMGLGTWAWGNKFLWGYEEAMDEELKEVFDLVVSRGINIFDTADSYGTGALSGRSEQLLGQFIKEYPGSDKYRSDIRFATKLAAYPWRLTPGQMVGACRASLDRLGMEKLAIGQLHWSTANYAPLQERVLWDGLVAMYEEGLVECVGVSNYGPQQLERIYTYLQERGVPLASAQVQFSLLSSGPEQEDLLSFCDANGIRVIAYSPLALGVLSGKYNADNLPQGPRGLLFRQLLPGLDPLLAVMAEIGQKRNKSLTQVAINWCMAKGTIPIPGAKTLQQAEESLGALGWRLSGNEVAALDDAAAEVPRPMIQNIFQTK
ncbi:hypothetical protein CLOM_g18750 [Closterium sp. NIES-68]|nr:hypothetical protein CLOM_g18750 [Closterium sp. NIES-68]GJP74776.1 hypothetical protein CLOP_g5314 [Closterium sp. NIES-67]